MQACTDKPVTLLNTPENVSQNRYNPLFEMFAMKPEYLYNAKFVDHCFHFSYTKCYNYIIYRVKFLCNFLPSEIVSRTMHFQSLAEPLFLLSV